MFQKLPKQPLHISHHLHKMDKSKVHDMMNRIVDPDCHEEERHKLRESIMTDLENTMSRRGLPTKLRHST